MTAASGAASDATSRGARRFVVVGVGVVGRRVSRLLGATAGATDDALVSTARLDVGATTVSDLGPGDVVVLATGRPHAATAAELAGRGASVVSVSDDVADVAELLDLDDCFRQAGATLVVGAAMAPGLSGLLVRHLATRLAVLEEIHVAFHATAGPACARQHHRALAGRAVGWHDYGWIERPAGSGRELCWFPEPVGARDCYRAELPDPILLHRSDPDVRRISARVSATRRDRLTARLPMLRKPHPEGGVGALRVEVRGAAPDGSRAVAIAGIAELVGTAAATTAVVFAEAIAEDRLSVGVVVTSDHELATDQLLARARQCGVRLQEFTGVPQA